jgi:hypothetical protein
MLELNVEAPTPLAVLPSLHVVIGIESAAASAGYPEEVAGGAHGFGQVERKTLSRRKCRGIIYSGILDVPACAQEVLV